MFDQGELYCSHCGERIFDDGHTWKNRTLCDECHEEAESLFTVCEYIKAYPERFFDYLSEGVTSDTEEIKALLAEYRTLNEEEYTEWLV